MRALDDLASRIGEAADAKRQIAAAEALQAEFAALDRRKVAGWSEIELAAWQARYPADSPQHRLGEHEWQSRLTAQQVGAMRFAAWLSGGFGLAGVALGFALGKLWP